MPAMTKTDAAFEELRKLIYAGKLRAGQRLPVSELMVMLQMSPTPIREALRLLQAAGLVVHESHHGMVVRTYSEPKDEELYELRAVLEPLAAERAAQTASADQRAEIKAALENMRILTASPSRTKGALEKISNAHQRLFNAIFGASNSELLIGFLDQLRNGARPQQPMHQWEDTLEEQAEIVTAILEQQPKRARKAMGVYLAHVRSLAKALAEKISTERSGRPVKQNGLTKSPKQT